LQAGSDAWKMQTEVLVQGDPLAAVEVKVRFLKLVGRSVSKRTGRVAAQQPAGVLDFEPVSSLEVDGKVFTPWQEAIECEVSAPVRDVGSLVATPLKWRFSFPAKRETEFVFSAGGETVGQIERKQEAIEGIVEITALLVADRVFKVQVRVKNLTLQEYENSQTSRESALMHSLVSAHTLVGVWNGEFVSLLDPPDGLKDLATRCQNVGVWPVLVGEQGQRHTMLASPIILYDYPQIAPESPGDLFDGTEIDEILALRIMTMTDAEKSEMRNTDERSRRILERTEALPMEHLMKLHGTLRELHSLKEEAP